MPRRIPDPPDPKDHPSLFVAGYEKGREDGIAQACSVVDAIISLYPNYSARALSRLLPGNTVSEIYEAMKDFGDRERRRGRREEKETRQRKAEAEAEANAAQAQEAAQ